MSAISQGNLDTDALVALMDASAKQLLAMAENLTAVAHELRARHAEEGEARDRPDD